MAILRTVLRGNVKNGFKRNIKGPLKDADNDPPIP